MQWKAIKEQAELYRRDQIVYPKRWWNEGKSLLANMYPSACKSLTQAYDNASDGTSYDLPSGFKYVYKVFNNEYPTATFIDFSVDPITKKIVFKLDGSYTLHYLTETADVIGIESEVPEINTAYHYPLTKYIAAKELEYIRDQRHMTLMQQFYQDVDQANKSILRGNIGKLKLPRRTFR